MWLDNLVWNIIRNITVTHLRVQPKIMCAFMQQSRNIVLIILNKNIYCKLKLTKLIVSALLYVLGVFDLISVFDYRVMNKSIL